MNTTDPASVQYSYFYFLLNDVASYITIHWYYEKLVKFLEHVAIATYVYATYVVFQGLSLVVASW